MAQMLAGDIRKGVTFEFKSGVYTVTDFQHVKPGKGAAFVRYIKENDVVTVKFLYGNAFSVEPENFVELKVIEAEPGVKGNTATNVMKNAKVETGAIIQVPMFVNEGETIRIDTRTGEYMSRV